jgi:signal transduction histidine kinase
MKIQYKLMAGYLAVALLVGIVGYLGIQSSTNNQQLFNQLVDENLAMASALQDLKFTGIDFLTASSELSMLYVYPVRNEPDIAAESAEISELKQELAESYERYEALVNQFFPHDKEDAATLKDILENFQTSLGSYTDLLREGAGSETVFAAKKVYEGFEHAFTDLLERELQANLEIVTAQDALLEEQLSNSIAVIAVGRLIAIVVAIGGGILISRSISRPIVALQSVSEQMSHGHYDVRATITSRDEIGHLGKAFNEMVASIEERDANLRELNTNLEKRVDERTAELQKANAIAQESIRLKSEFMATMSHELRTPLNAILGFSSILTNGMAGTIDEEAKHMVKRVETNSHRLLALINDVLDLAKIEAGRMELVSKPIQLRGMVSRWQSEMSVLGEKKGLAFETVIGPDVPDTIYGDSDRITQIVTNLLSNAFKFTQRGSVKLEVKREEDYLLIQVSDTGIGIPPHAINYIFDEFRQVDGSSTRVYGGSGLGLSIVRNMCRIMGGNVKAASVLGKGSVFTATLPLITSITSPEQTATMRVTA